MTVLTTMIGRLRTDLQDASAATWTDAELTDHLHRAVREFSIRIPRERRSTVTTTAGSRTVDISSLTDLIEVVAVEWPVGQFPAIYQPFSYFGGVLTLVGADQPSAAESAIIYWLSPHTLDNAVSTIPAHLEDLILLGAGAYVLLDQAVATVNAVATGGAETREAYRRLGAERLDRFHHQLGRLARSSRVRARRLYTPARPAVSQATDPGP